MAATRYAGPLFGSHGHKLVFANALIWAALVVAVTSLFKGADQPTRLLLLLVAVYVRYY